MKNDSMNKIQEFMDLNSGKKKKTKRTSDSKWKFYQRSKELR